MIAKKILKKYLEYICFWNASKGANNPPSKILEQQLTSLLNAVGISGNNDDDEYNSFFYFFENGDFFQRETHSNIILTAKMQTFVEKCIRESRYADRLNAMRHNIQYDSIFRLLLSFRVKIEMLYIPDGIQYEGFGNFANHFSNYQKGIILKPLKEMTKQIDEILCLLIDPAQKEIDKKTLIAEYGYPTEDLKNAANEWFSGAF